MKQTALQDISIAEIRVVNPRTRSKPRFLAIVASIESVGLKKPITVSAREPAEDGTKYDLVCGQGRMEAFLALSQTTIPALVVNKSKEDQYLMSLVENVARRPPSNKDIFREVLNLKHRGYGRPEIAEKLGRDTEFVGAILNLIDKGEPFLVEAIEASKIPVSIAVLIAAENDPGIQLALSEAYESGALRGSRFKEAKQIIARCAAKRRERGQPANKRKLTGEALVKEYQQRTREQQALVKRAEQTRDNLLIMKSAIRKLLSEEHFVALLRAEGLADIPEPFLVESDQGAE